MAPDVSQLDFYFAKTLFDADIFADFNTWANDPNGPRQMNASFGECEANPTNPVTGPLAQQPYGTELGDELQAMGDPILRQAAIEGRTLFSSAGDTGSGCPELVAPVVGAGNGVAIQPVPFVGYPCDSQYVVCVGGTVVSANGADVPARPPSGPPRPLDVLRRRQQPLHRRAELPAGGHEHQPALRQRPDRERRTPAPPPTCRGVPDIGDLSGNITGDGYFIYSDGEPSSEGGTSLSSPLMLGQWARVQAGGLHARSRAAGGARLRQPGDLPPGRRRRQLRGRRARARTPPTYARDFFDVTQSEFGAGNGAYQPGPGWDYASGWGSLNVAQLHPGRRRLDQPPAPATAPRRRPRSTLTTASMTSPTGNATNPVDVSLGNGPSLDLTKATLTTSSDGIKIAATLSGPSVGTPPPSDAPAATSTTSPGGTAARSTTLRANEPSAGTFTYTSGNTGTYGTVEHLRLQRRDQQRRDGQLRRGDAHDHDHRAGQGGRLPDRWARR